jgi:hypothetical protein
MALLYVLYSQKEKLIKGDIVHLGSGVQHTNLEVIHIIIKYLWCNSTSEPISNIEQYIQQI